MTTSFEQGPYVKAAFFCEQVLREADGVVSPIRVVDRVEQTAHGPEAPDEMPPLSLRLYAVVMLVPGRTQGRHAVRLEVESPAGELRAIGAHDLMFEADDKSVVLITEMNAIFSQEGLYWMKVSFDGEQVTRSPLRVIYQRLGSQG